jgi:hypothetical protein
MKKGKEAFLALTLVSLILAMANISALVYFTQPQSYYNLGDVIEVNINVDPVLEGFLKVELICGNGAINVFNGVPGEDGKVDIKFPLTYSYIKENTGQCYFSWDYFGISGQSTTFEISKALKVSLDIESLVAKPGEEVTISGRADRLNGAGVNGEVEVTIPLLKLITEGSSNNTETGGTENQSEEQDATEQASQTIVNNGAFYGKIQDGIFTVTFRLKEDTPAGDYRIDVLAYERDALYKITSEGVAMANLKVLPILKSIDVAISGQSIDPGTEFEFKPMLFDQSGQPIKDEVSVIIRNEIPESIFEKIVQSGDSQKYKIPANLTAGYYELTASSGELGIAKKFYVNEKAIASFELKNGTLLVTNIGNIPYKKDIQIELNGKPFIKKMNLELGAGEEFKLTGDGSQYDIKVSDGDSEVSQSGVILTGRAVSVVPVSEDGSVALNTPIVWIIVLVILAVLVIFLLRKVLRKKSFAYPIKEKIKEKLGFKKKSQDLVQGLEQNNSDGKKMILPIKSIVANQAEQVLVLKGDKNRVSMLVLKIKNKLTKNSKDALTNLTKPITNNKGSIYEKGDYLFGIFSPLITKSFKNEMLAAKSAETIKESLIQYNKKFLDKIDFGIGIGSGDIVNTVEGGKLKFTALGNIMPSARKVADASSEQILLTKEAFERLGTEVKTEKKGEFYEIKKVIDQEKNEAFIKGFLERMSKDEKKNPSFNSNNKVKIY